MWCFAHFDLQMCFAPQPRAIFEHRNFQNGSDNEVICTFWLANVLRATAACHFRGSQLQKWLPPWGVLRILTYEWASRHSRVPFFDIGTTKIGPKLRCFVHFDLQTCFAPQRCAIFRHRNYKNWSEAAVFCTFWLANVLRATAVCHFSFLCWTATSAPAALGSLLFQHQQARFIEKTQRFATSLTFFAHVPSF